jgi:gamma-glutamylcysteine synthetase
MKRRNKVGKTLYVTIRRYDPTPVSRMVTLKGFNLVLRNYRVEDAHKVMVEAFKQDEKRRLRRRLSRKGDGCQRSTPVETKTTGSSSVE